MVWTCFELSRRASAFGALLGRHGDPFLGTTRHVRVVTSSAGAVVPVVGSWCRRRRRIGGIRRIRGIPQAKRESGYHTDEATSDEAVAVPAVPLIPRMSDEPPMTIVARTSDGAWMA